jgi:CBS domain-containing protein
MAAGLPTIGRAHAARVLEAADHDPPVCAPSDAVADVVAALDRRGANVCVVVNEHNIVLGRLRRDRVHAADGRAVEDAMEPGPGTVRAHEDLAETLERMARHHVASLLVTTPEGVLLGELKDAPHAD